MIAFKIGILGAGGIAGKVADTLKKVDGIEVYCVGSRDIENAKSFASTYEIPKAYGSYEEVANDPEVELVYIATVNSNHAELAKMCLNAGKPVLVEKPFSYNAATAKEVIDLAREKNLFCGEAMWLKFLPIFSTLIAHLRNNAIGDIRFVTANLGYNLRDKERLVEPALAGGALLDLGVYPLNFIFSVMGTVPVSMTSSYARTNSGVDGLENILMTFPQGRMASVHVSMRAKLDNRVMIYGTNGYIEVDNVNCPTKIDFYTPNGEIFQTITPDDKFITGYEYQFISARDAVIVGKLEPEQQLHSNVLYMMQFMDTIRKSWGLKFPLPGEDDNSIQLQVPSAEDTETEADGIPGFRANDDVKNV